MELSCDASENKPIMKPKSLSYEEKTLILAFRTTQLDSPRGIQKIIFYYIVTYFIIRGNKECYNLK